ncbi:MAG: hypothetical protein KAT57_01895, partial [Candidatus Lokiarchaeota archaeon]|nr:hypothetical protein [Candidatus Lokiarchaeota archaeon]
LEQLLSKAYYYAYFNRGWKDTFIRLIKKKGLQFLFNSKKIFRAIKDFLNFFLDIRRMREKSES